MSRPTTITTTMAREMTALRDLGVPITRIARKFNLSQETVRRHTSPDDAAAIQDYQRRRYERDRADPEILERRRADAREKARQRRLAEKALRAADADRHRSV